MKKLILLTIMIITFSCEKEKPKEKDIYCDAHYAGDNL